MPACITLNLFSLSFVPNPGDATGGSVGSAIKEVSIFAVTEADMATETTVEDAEERKAHTTVTFDGVPDLSFSSDARNSITADPSDPTDENDARKSISEERKAHTTVTFDGVPDLSFSSDARGSITPDDPSDPTDENDARKSISHDPWELIDKTARMSICMEHRKSIDKHKPRMSIRNSIFLDPYEIIDEVDDDLKWEGMHDARIQSLKLH